MRSLFALALFASLAGAQTSNPLTDAVMKRYTAVKRYLIDTAQLMPEEKYDFRLTPEQRPFGEWIAHTAMGNYNFCAAIQGAAPPVAEMGEAAKAQAVKALKDSFSYCDAALKNMNDRKALTEVTAGGKKVYPVEGMIALVASGNEHYGNLVGYLRSNGITPPSSARGGTKHIPEQPRPGRLPSQTTPPTFPKK